MWEDRIYELLIVEDNKADAFLLKHYLGDDPEFKCTFELAETLKEAKEKIDEQKFDLMFLDLGLPGFFGDETIKHMSAYMQKTPTIILTGNVDKELGMKGIEYGAQGFICKDNYDSNLLKKTILMAIDNFDRLQRDIL